VTSKALGPVLFPRAPPCLGSGVLCWRLRTRAADALALPGALPRRACPRTSASAPGWGTLGPRSPRR